MVPLGVRATVLVAALCGGCALFGTERPESLPVTWRPFRLAVLADPDLDAPESGSRLARAAAMLAGDRYIDAVVVTGRLGDGGAARVRELLAPALRPVIVVEPGDAARAAWSAVPGAALLTVSRAAADGAARSLRGRDAEFRGRWVAVALDASLRSGGEAPQGEVELAYSVEALERIRVLLVPGAAAGLHRAAGLVVVETPPLAAGAVRLLAVRGNTLETWMRDLESAADGPVSTAQTR